MCPVYFEFTKPSFISMCVQNLTCLFLVVIKSFFLFFSSLYFPHFSGTLPMVFSREQDTSVLQNFVLLLLFFFLLFNFFFHFWRNCPPSISRQKRSHRIWDRHPFCVSTSISDSSKHYLFRNSVQPDIFQSPAVLSILWTPFPKALPPVSLSFYTHFKLGTRWFSRPSLSSVCPAIAEFRKTLFLLPAAKFLSCLSDCYQQFLWDSDSHFLADSCRCVLSILQENSSAFSAI